MADLSEEEVHLVGHALGVNQKGREFRNHYVIGPAGADYDAWESMVERGLARRHGPSPLYGGDYCYVVTEAGKVAFRQRAAITTQKGDDATAEGNRSGGS